MVPIDPLEDSIDTVPDPNTSNREEGEFLSIDEEVEVVQGDQIARLFSPGDYHSLLCKCITALDLKGPPQGAEAPVLDSGS